MDIWWNILVFISFFLLSDYPIQDYPFNHKKTYEVLKDALSLAAAFLAPVAAFVLFSDWRDQHRSISNEKVSRQIVDNLSDLLPFIGKSYIYLTNQEEINKFSQAYFSYVIELGRNATSINAINSESEKFINDMKDINLLLMNIWFSLERQIVLNQELEKITSFDERSEALRKSYFKNIQEAGLNKDQYVSEFLNLKNTIRILYV